MAKENQVESIVNRIASFIGLRNASSNSEASQMITLADGKKITREQAQQAISGLIETSVSRMRQDIGKFSLARRTAEDKIMPRRKLLLDLYDDVDLDNHIHGLIQHTIMDRLMAEPFKVMDAAGEEDEEKTRWFENQWFYDAVQMAVDHFWYGHSLLQFDYPHKDENGELTYDCPQLIPRRHVRPEKGLLLIHDYDDDSNRTNIDYRNDKQYAPLLIEVGKPTNLGLFLKAAPQFIFKKNAEQFWSEYQEVFGAPFRWATTPSRNKQDQQLIGDTLKNLGFAAYGVFPSDVEIKFLETVKGDAYQVYMQLMNFANSELSKLFAGVTMMNDNGSSKSQSEVHERGVELLIETLKRFVKAFVKEQLFPMMISHGFDLKGCRWEYETEKDLDGLYDKVIGLLKYFDLEEDWITETFGIPITGAKAQPTTDPNANPADDNADPGVAPKKGQKKKG